MALWPAFCGGFYESLSPVIAADTAVNVFTETREVPGSEKHVTLYGTPGLLLNATVAGLGNRGWFTQDGRTWTVSGGRLYEREVTGAYTDRGAIADDGNPVSFTSNGIGGDQLGIVGGGDLYVLDLSTNVLSTVALPFANPVMIAFLDGYGLINQRDTSIVWFCAIEDLTDWDALDFFTRSGTSDNIVGIAVTRDRVWGLGSKTSTLFYDSGDADTPFVPYPGTAMQTGLVSPWLLAVYEDALYFVAASAGGQWRVVKASEPQAQRISTRPIERFLASCSTLDDARCLFYVQEGHPFFVMTCPSASADYSVVTYAFDDSEGLWAGRAGWDETTGTYTPWRAAGATVIDGTVYVGDRENGNLYTLDLDTFEDDGVTIRRERTVPYLSAENQFVFLDQFELGIQPGVGLSSGQGSAPLVNLEVSRDGARTWVNAGTASLGAQGQYTERAIWRNLGRFRADRMVVRVTQTDPVKCVWGPGAWLRITAGTGQA